MATPRIYTAVYSGVAVFEMVVKDIAIMRRRADSHMNATQILKVAGIDKGKRTKILEREILPGEHEKVQGGYGKFQGTWIPLQASIDLAKRYDVYDLIKQMIEFNPATAGNIDEKGHVPTKEQAQLYERQSQPSKKKRDLAAASSTISPDILTRKSSEASSSSVAGIAAAASSSSSPSYQHRRTEHNDYPVVNKKARLTSHIEPSASDHSGESKHRAILMSIFLSDDPGNLQELLKTSKGINLDLVLDEQGNTALHWAASLARLYTVEQLIAHGADANRRNYSGETPLMRSVAATNSFDRDCFRKLLKCLEGSIYVTDHKRRTVIHHTVITAGINGRAIAALYYMHHLIHALQKLSASPSARNKTSLLDMQDDQGDTALNIAARLDCPRMVELLVEAGANKSSENNLGLSVNDYTMEESTKAVPQYSQSQASASQGAASSETLKVPTASATLYGKRSVGSSQRGKEIVATVQKIVDALDEEYGDMLESREKQLKETDERLEKATQELELTRKELEKRQEQSQLLAEGQQKVRNLKQAMEAGWSELKTLLGKTNEALDKEAVLKFDVDRNIDAMFDIKPANDDHHDLTKKEGGEEEDVLIKLKARVYAYRLNNNALKTYVDGLRAETAEKELQCKRLIAACCSLPLDKIDELVEPLTLAIESDPPDLDLARVIGFMEKIRRQGAFPDASSSTDEDVVFVPHAVSSPSRTVAATTGSTSLPSASSSSSMSATVAEAPSSLQPGYDGLPRNTNTAVTSHIRTSTQPVHSSSP